MADSPLDADYFLREYTRVSSIKKSLAFLLCYKLFEELSSVSVLLTASDLPLFRLLSTEVHLGFLLRDEPTGFVYISPKQIKRNYSLTPDCQSSLPLP